MRNSSGNSNVHALALLKVSEAVGPTRAHSLLGTFLADQDRGRLTSASDLEAFGSHLEQAHEAAQQVGSALRRYAALLSGSSRA
jgi:hypothetical protein